MAAVSDVGGGLPASDANGWGGNDPLARIGVLTTRVGGRIFLEYGRIWRVGGGGPTREGRARKGYVFFNARRARRARSRSPTLPCPPRRAPTSSERCSGNRPGRRRCTSPPPPPAGTRPATAARRYTTVAAPRRPGRTAALPGTIARRRRWRGRSAAPPSLEPPTRSPLP